MARIDWSKALDLDRAAQNIRLEMGPNDWYEDPWDWPELEFVRKKAPDLFAQHLAGKGSLESALVDVPKENWGTRPAVVLDLMDRLAYQALVDRVSVQLIGGLTPDAYGWRLPAVSPTAGRYSRNKRQWDGYRRHLGLLVSIFDVALKTDIVSFFASLPVEPVQEAIQDRTASGAVTTRLCDLIEGFAQVPNRSGLAQRSFASAVIANMYLLPLDDVLSSSSTPIPTFLGGKVKHRSFTRWMDDILWFGSDPAVARRVQMELQSEARTLGLNLADGKTEVLEGAEVAQLLQIEHSAVDDAIDNHSDFKPLEELVDGLLDKREHASRSSIRFVARRMRENSHHYRVQDIAGLAPRMPHVADAWADLFKQSFTQSSLQAWFLEYASSEWATHEWSVAHFAHMFPSKKVPNKKFRAFFEDKVRDSNTSLPLLAVSAQRLCAWDPPTGRAACRDAFKRASTPHARRVIAFASLSVGESRTTIRRWLSVDKENYPALRMLEAEGYVARRVELRFAG